jgi:hypothetical protein
MADALPNHLLVQLRGFV